MDQWKAIYLRNVANFHDHISFSSLHGGWVDARLNGSFLTKKVFKSPFFGVKLT
jgi:hypothetical protein